MTFFHSFGPLIGSIDEGTSSARFLVFAANTAEMLTYHQVPVTTITEKEGWAEQDPCEIFSAVLECIRVAVLNLQKLDINPADIVAVGLTNQRETLVVWDKVTGKPLYNAIVWSDTRNQDTVEYFLSKTKGWDADFLKPLCGLPISTYFTAPKMRWLMDNVPLVREKVENEECMIGNVDSWLIWNLTGGVRGGVHVTDVTNASRTMLMNINTSSWDPVLLQFFGIPVSILPSIRSSSEIYGYIIDGVLHGIPISGCLGDQQAALVGQMCFSRGQAKNTYGTGCFLLCNTGTSKVWSTHGLLTTVAYKMGPKAPVVYALEGSIAGAGSAISWLKNNVNLISEASETEKICVNSSHINDVYFVPAFSGLFAPYWRNDARGIFCNLTRDTVKADIIKAVLEAVCFQTRDILEAMNRDSSISNFEKLLVDGGMTENNLLMQLQADLIGIPVVRPILLETTALGAAIAAGCAEGIDVINLKNIQSSPNDVFLPALSDDERDVKYEQWKMAIERSLGWVTNDESVSDEEQHVASDSVVESRLSSCGIFAIICVGLLIIADRIYANTS